MKRWIHATTVNGHADYAIVGHYKIVINIDVSNAVNIIHANYELDRYPGDAKFARDAKYILEGYNFIVVPDNKGRLVDIHDSDWGISVYFNCIYDLANISDFDELIKLAPQFKDQKVGIGCAVEIRISNHFLTAGRGSNEDKYARNQVNHTLQSYPSVDYHIDNQYQINLDKHTLAMQYSSGLNQLRNELNTFVRRCANAVSRAREEGRWNGSLTLKS